MFRRMSLSLLSAAIVAGTLVILVPQVALAAPPTTPDPGVWSADGKVYSLAHANGVVYAGGTFKRVLGFAGQKASVLNLAAFNQATGVWISTFAPTVEFSTGKAVKVSALALSNDGTMLYVGGQFDTVDGQPANNFAVIDPTTGALITTVSINANQAVDVILPGPSLTYIGGAFTKVNGEVRQHLAAINPDATLSETWTPTAEAGDCPPPFYNSNTCSNGGRGTIRSMTMSPDGQSLYIGGEFYYVNGTDQPHWRNCIALLDATNGSLKNWSVPWSLIPGDAQTHKPGPNMLWKMVLYPASNPTMIIGAFGRVPNYVFAFHIDQGDTGNKAWNNSIGTSGNDESLALSSDGTRLFVGGHFGTARLDQQFCNQWVHGLMSVNPATGGVYCDWFPAIKPFGGVNAPGHGIDKPNFVGGWANFIDGNTLWVGGFFTSINGFTQSGIARFTLVGPPPPPVPVISGFTPTQGPVGTPVTISGYGFTGASEVKFGDVDAGFTVDNDGQITATVPDGAVTAPITVVAPGGSVDTELKKFHVTT